MFHKQLTKLNPSIPTLANQPPNLPLTFNPIKKITIFEAILQKLRLDILGNYEQHSHKEKKYSLLEFPSTIFS